MGPAAEHGSPQLGCPSPVQEPLIWGDKVTSQQEWRERPEFWWSELGECFQAPWGELEPGSCLGLSPKGSGLLWAFHLHPSSLLPWLKCILVIS